ncbi:MAG: matrixin family metalloprotease, partial [Planctomycetota bacterium]
MIREFFVTAAIGVASLSSAAAPTERTDQTPKASDEVVERALAKHLFKMLPREEQRRIRVARGLPADPSRFADGASRDFVGPLDPRIERLTPYASVEVLSRIDERMLNFLALTHEEAQRGPVSAQACFTPGTDPAVVEIIESIYRENGERFVLTSRWAATATNPAPLFDNNPITLTYSFVPDGTPVTDRFSTPPGGPAVQVGSNLFSWLNGIYGSPAVWQALFARVFDDWSALTGTTYVFEPMDDGVPVDDGLFGPPVNNGILGQRGDVRINAIPLDGPGGTLAFNLFPQSGDMTFDSADTSYASNAGINDDIFFRNVTAHEHGHGLGLLHTCPLDGTKLMEPFIQLGFDGPQFDDVLGASVRYGDRTEPNGTIGQAIGLGTSSKVASTVENVSINFNAELDFFTFSVPSGSTAIFEAIPVGPDGLSGAQLASGCGVGTPVDFSAIADLRIEVVSPAPETIDRLLAGGTERLVVRNDSGSTQNYTVAIASTTPSTLPEALFDAQAYTASLRNVAAAADLAPAARFLDEDTRNLPGQNSLVFDLSVIPVLASIPPTSVEVALTTSNPPSQLFATAEFVSGNTYRADFGTLACGPDYQVEATVQFENAPSVTSSVTVDRENDLAAGDFFDSFEANRGWLALNAFAANEGLWQRGVPV